MCQGFFYYQEANLEHCINLDNINRVYKSERGMIAIWFKGESQPVRLTPEQGILVWEHIRGLCDFERPKY